MEESQKLHYITGVLIVCVGGLLGGLVSGIGAIVEGGRDAGGAYLGAKGVPIWLFLTGRCAVGIGGATAVLLASLSVNKFTGSSDIDLLALSALSFVAGSIGYRLLPMVAAQIERRLGEAERKMEQAVKQVEETHDSVGMNSAVITAMGILDRKEQMTAIADQTITDLERFSKDFPRERTLHFVLARMYRHKKNNLDRAISTLRRFIKHKGQARDKDVADALFNIACYLSLEAALEADEEAKTQLTAEGLQAIGLSVAMSPENTSDARTDKDLEELRTSEQFEAVLTSSSPTK